MGTFSRSKKRALRRALTALTLSAGLVVGFITPADNLASAAVAAPLPGPTFATVGEDVGADGAGADAAVADQPPATPEVPAQPEVPAEPDEPTAPPVDENPEASTSETAPDAPATLESAEAQAAPLNEEPESESLADASRSAMAASNALGCNYADSGTGAYADSLCWFDFSGFTTEYVAPTYTAPSCSWLGLWNCTTTVSSRSVLGSNYDQVSASGSATAVTQNSAEANSRTNALANAELYQTGGKFYGNIANWPLSVDLPGGYELTAKLSARGSGTNGSMTAAAKEFPTWNDGPSARAFLGTGNFYTGVGGKPALYNHANGQGNTKLTLDEISVELAGIATKEFTIVVADAESTDGSSNNNRESIDWSTTGAGFTWLPNNPATIPATKDSVMGNACGGTTSPGIGSNPSPTARCQAGSSQPSPKTGTPMLQTRPHATNDTFKVEQTLNYNTSGSKQGVAFGVIFARAEAEVIVADRIIDQNSEPGDTDFTIKGFNSHRELMNASTGPVGTSAQDVEGIPVVTGGTQLRYESVVSGVHSTDYTAGWQCLKTDPLTNTTTYWPNNAAPEITSPTAPGVDASFTKIKFGQYLKCTVTYTPPYLTLLKKVDNSTALGAANTAADWNLTAESTQSKLTINGGPATDPVKVPVAVDNAYSLSEAPVQEANIWQHGYTLRNLVCDAPSGALTLTRDPAQPDANTGAITGANLKIAKGNDVTCTYKNEANKPDLKVKKEANPATTTVVAEGQEIEYTLTFDNSEGTAKIAADYVDYLADVLDDADLLDSDGIETTTSPNLTVAVTPAGIAWSGDVVFNVASKTITINGDVPAYTKLTVKFKVKVKNNDEDPLGRTNPEAATGGFALNNFLVESGDSVPTKCEADRETCTTHPVRAWTVEKNSQPQDGTAVHIGANNYFRVKVTNFAKGESLSGITLKDDMTSSLFAGHMDLNAPQAVTVPWGISFYDEHNKNIEGQNISWTAVDGSTIDGVQQPKLVYTGEADFNTDFPSVRPEFPNGEPFAGTWTLNVPEFRLPAGASYAVIGYAIKIGQIADPENGTRPYLNGDSPVAAAPNSFWVNTAAASKASFENSEAPIEPNRCRISDLDNKTMLPGWDESKNDYDNFGDCKTYHTLEESFFHLWKYGSDVVDEENPQGNNLQGAHFILADTKEEAEAGEASKWLCRADNRVMPGGADGTFTITDKPGASVGAGTGDDAWDFKSRQSGGVYDSLMQANLVRAAYINANPGTDVQLLDMCGLFYQHTDGTDRDGQPVGSWHAQDIRGGNDTNWRNDTNQPGTYWVAETKSPTDYQLLAQPMKLWVAPSIPTPNGLYPGHRDWYDYQGKLSMPVVGEGETWTEGMGGAIAGEPDIRSQCESPWKLPINNQPACVMPTGWTMPIFDAKLQPLPLTGGIGAGWLVGAGAAGFALILGIAWWRRRKVALTATDLL